MLSTIVFKGGMAEGADKSKKRKSALVRVRVFAQWLAKQYGTFVASLFPLHDGCPGIEPRRLPVASFRKPRVKPASREILVTVHVRAIPQAVGGARLNQTARRSPGLVCSIEPL
jgi:hypothetical protein